jgi:hypothetical protein
MTTDDGRGTTACARIAGDVLRTALAASPQPFEERDIASVVADRPRRTRFAEELNLAAAAATSDSRRIEFFEPIHESELQNRFTSDALMELLMLHLREVSEPDAWSAF